MTALLDDAFFLQDINPFLYAPYPLADKYKVSHRDESVLGVPPSKALVLSEKYASNIENKVNLEWTKENFPFQYQLPLAYKGDWVNLYEQVAGDKVRGIVSEEGNRLLDASFKAMRLGDYKIKLVYRLPGGKNSLILCTRIKINGNL